MDRTMKCPKCSAENLSWQERCQSCGARLHEEDEVSNMLHWGELAQSRVAVWTAVGIIFFIDLLNIVLSIILSIMPGALEISSIVIDLYLGINLLRGKRWARKWMLIRVVLGLLVWGILAIFQKDFGGLIMQAGFCGAILLLLTGISTRNRILEGIALFVIFFITGLVLSLTLA